MKTFRTTVLAMGVVFGATSCATISGNSPRQISEAETNQFLADLDLRAKKHVAEFKEYKETIRPIWVQPANVRNACKLAMMASAAEEDRIRNDLKFYWDGGCQDGYAHGLGRAFVDSNNGLVSWLEEYVESGKGPENYGMTEYDRSVHYIGDQEKGTKGIAVSDTLSGPSITNMQTIMEADTGISYLSRYDSAPDAISLIKRYPQGFGYQFILPQDPSSQVVLRFQFLDGGGKPFGYVVERLKNGAVNHVSIAGSPERVALPEEFLQSISSVQSEIAEKMKFAESYIELAKRKQSIYTRRICKGEVKVDYVSSEIYGRICLEEGELTPQSERIAKTLESVRERRKANFDMAMQQAQVAAQRSAALAQQQQAQAMQRSQQQGAISAFAEGTEQAASQAAAFTQAMIQGLNSRPTFQMQPRSGQSMCTLTGNIVSCRAR